jgi:hypothetical protein
MASSGKRKTTMAKLARESRLRERRMEKQEKKDARKREPAHDPDAVDDVLHDPTAEPALTAGVPSVDSGLEALTDA